MFTPIMCEWDRAMIDHYSRCNFKLNKLITAGLASKSLVSTRKLHYAENRTKRRKLKNCERKPPLEIKKTLNLNEIVYCVLLLIYFTISFDFLCQRPIFHRFNFLALLCLAFLVCFMNFFFWANLNTDFFFGWISQLKVVYLF